MIKIYLLMVLIISLINGCTSIDYTRPAEQKAPVSEPAAQGRSAEEVIQQPKVITTAALDNRQTIKTQQKSVPASRQAVLDLLAQSKAAIDQQNYDEAENLLKRALRIEPGNAWLWHNMAVVKFYQNDFQQAIQQALKSNNLINNSPKLRANNGKIIKQSYIELGEPEKARHY